MTSLSRRAGSLGLKTQSKIISLQIFGLREEVPPTITSNALSLSTFSIDSVLTAFYFTCSSTSMRCCRPRDQHHQNMIRLMSPLDSFRHRHTSTASYETSSLNDKDKEQWWAIVAMSATITKEEIEERMKKPLIQVSQ